MLESESNALPLGDTPSFSRAEKLFGVIEEDRTLDLQSHNLAFYQLNYDHHMVLPEGFEPSTSALEGRCSIQLSYGSILERVKGIGPSRPAWKASVLPLNYTRANYPCILSSQNTNVKEKIKKNKKDESNFRLLNSEHRFFNFIQFKFVIFCNQFN